MTEKHSYTGVYLKIVDNPIFWYVEHDNKRYKVADLAQVYRMGLRRVLTISQEEMDDIPIGEIDRLVDTPTLPSISTFYRRYTDEIAWIVGSGPSIANLRKTHIKGGPVIAINYATEKVESFNLKNDIFSLQKDRCFVKPKQATLLVHSVESRYCFDGYKPQHIFSVEDDFGIHWSRPSDVICVSIAHKFGCKRINYLCCDASASQTLGSYYDGEVVLNENAPQMIQHRVWIEELSEKLKIEIKFITPQEPKS